ncbi:MAG TPA: hypothetical protein VF331_27360 [Polyangiales bacterium]
MTLRTLAIQAGATVALVVVASGCAGPLIVTAAQSHGDDVKFAYTQAGSGHQGLIECKVPASGDLQDCRHLKINFQE